ncbi:signal peptidase I [Microbacterium hominis]|uniref:Signal peptidase I n=1 Tax=Microbacterium hominis TaxID=162426 RepID=A0A7D4UIV2_9MICO|nr:signal peptidase I [Microbacterium hominis]QKJ20308.1 signal peptidase I [Microbacterium hominis]
MSPRRPVWRRVTGSAWFHLFAAFVLVGLLLSFVAKPFWVPSSSMADTLEPGDRILVNRLAYLGDGPRTGDVVVFDADDAWGAGPPTPTDPVRGALRWLGAVTGFGPSSEHTLVKRVIAGPGQTARCCSDAGAVVVDGAELDEPYITNDFPFDPGVLDCTTSPRSARCFDEVIVPDDEYLMLGDNRSGSADSAFSCRTEGSTPACWRWAIRDGVIGKAVAILWPIERWNGL